MARSIARPATGDRQNNLFMLGGIGLALLAAIFAFGALRTIGGDGGTTAPADTVERIVAARRIEANETITADLFEPKSISESILLEDAYTLPDEVIGLVARYPIDKGEQFVPADLGRESGGTILSDLVPKNKRGISVEVSAEGIAGGLLAPGDRVDVIAVVDLTVGEEDVPTAILLVQNAEVAAVADKSLEGLPGLDAEGNPIPTDEATGVLGEQPDDLESDPEASSVTLLVNPQDSLAIALAQEEGSLRLSIRGNGDNETLPIENRRLTE